VNRLSAAWPHDDIRVVGKAEAWWSGDPLRSRKGTGRPSKLTAKQKRRVFRGINGEDPRQYGFDSGLWTRQIVAELIAERFGVDLSLALVGKLLAQSSA
jgi:transposase